MDVFNSLQELHKQSIMDTLGRPLVSIEKNNGIATIATTTRCSRSREVNSRYRSPTPAPATTPKSRRCPSPSLARNVNPSPTPLVSAKRAISAERKRPSTPPSPSRPSTPASDTSVESKASSKRMTSSRLPEVLWPSTMRSLSVSFQSDSISIPVNKKEKPVSHALLDRTLKPSLNVAHRQAEAVTGLRKATLERKRSPLKGKNSTHQSENSRPIDGVHARLIDQHRWPSRAGGGRLSTSMLTTSIDLSNNGMPSLRILSADGIPRYLQKMSTDVNLQQPEFENHISALGLRMNSVDDSLLRVSGLQNVNSLSLSEKAVLGGPTVRSRLMPGSRLPSPSRPARPVLKVTPSPSKTRPSTPTQSRGVSPSRVRQSSPTRQPSSTASVLSFVADIKKGKKINQLEDAHQLRLLYNRQLQWHFANACSDSALFVQKITTEQMLYNVRETNLELSDSVLRKRVELQRLNMDFKLSMMLREQMAQLEDWALLEEEHSYSLDRAIEDLEASTLRLPVASDAKADIDSLKVAISYAADVMQMMGSSICSLLSKAEGMNGLVSELAELAGHERSTLNECDTLMSSSAAMQVKEHSLRMQLIQSLQTMPDSRIPFFGAN